MNRFTAAAIAAGTIALAACASDQATGTGALGFDAAISLASAYSTVPSGYNSLTSSFASGAEAGFQPGFDGAMGRRGGFGPPGAGPGFGLGLMGGGLDGHFLGDGIGRDFFHADTSCAFSATTGLVTCGPTTRNGLTITRVSAYTTAAGAAQSTIDSTTNAVASTATVTGTVVHMHRDSAGVIDTSTSAVNEQSAQTVTGLAGGSSARTINGSSAGSESTVGTSSQGAFTANRTAGDTVTGVVVPAASTSDPHPYPTAGSVVRSMQATVTISGQSPTTSSRREVITYDGSATAKIVITVDGTTQNCTVPLPHGRLTCS
ncbi:MAG TPA: hypothetical protein VH277_02235 [Gemmatimonadaceae bacterium]|jgi:hypothetical protein|nr:hypothetical protein [Gemmatimonadaceae bacterium]